MLIAIQRESGVRAEGILLAESRTRMRVAFPGSSDTEEWTQCDGVWRDESGQRIEIEAILCVLDVPGGGIPRHRSLPEVRFVGHVAGNGGMVAEDRILDYRFACPHGLEEIP